MAVDVTNPIADCVKLLCVPLEPLCKVSPLFSNFHYCETSKSRRDSLLIESVLRRSFDMNGCKRIDSATHSHVVKCHRQLETLIGWTVELAETVEVLSMLLILPPFMLFSSIVSSTAFANISLATPVLVTLLVVACNGFG
uniref:Uncharacterized protein n=1 Tax=Glossina brevipalpis TaxID=37001 RepID=A0A1A9WUF4_9MUSC